MANGIIEILNLTLARIFEILMTPVARWPLVALIIWSAVTGIVLAVAFRFTSNQRAIGRAADGSRAELLAINLFQDDLAGVFRSLGGLLKHVVVRIGYSVPPVIVIIVPLVLLLSQLALWYQQGPLTPGESAVVQMQISRDHWQSAQHAQLVSPAGVTVEAGPLRDVGQLVLFWRIKPDAASDTGIRVQQLQWDVGGDIVEKRLVTSSGSRQLCPVNAHRAGPEWWDQILYPGEPGLPRGGPVLGIEVQYPDRVTPVFGWDVPWWITFLIVSMLSAFAVKPLVGVKF